MGDPILDGVYAELIVTALLEAARSAIHTLRSSHSGSALDSALREDPVIARAVDDAVALLADVEAISPEHGGERLRAFLHSPECRNALVPIFYADRPTPPALATLRSGFASSLAHATGLPLDQVSASAERLYEALLAAARNALHAAIAAEDVAAHEALSHWRHTMLLDAVDNLQRSIALLRRPDLPSHDAIHAYAEEYRVQVAQREGTVVPPHLEGQARRPIDDIYVAPHLQPETTDRVKWAPIVYERFLGDLRRTVVLGDPGGGKTTLTKKIAWDLSGDARPDDASLLPPIAIRVILREYGAEKGPGHSLLLHIEQTASSRYQMPAAPRGTFEYLLRNGLAVVLFDGLDELLETSRRQEVAADIESFVTLFPATPVLVTSRRIGYDEAPLDARRFGTYSLQELDERQVTEYVTKAFTLDSEPMTADSPLVRTFLHESRTVADLRSNPLMLGLMCSLYRGESYIPSNRSEVYEKCAVMLFERWDRQRRISPAVPFESHLRPTMQFLAHWIFSTPALQSGVTRDALVAKTTEYLHGRRFADADDARAAAIGFIDFCKGRAWVFTDTGFDARGEPLFQFTHQTFLEYFTAAYLASIHPTPERLAQAMLPYVARREWYVVMQLAAQLQSRRVADSTDVLLEHLLDATLDEAQRQNVRVFVLDALSFLVPSPGLTKRILAAAVAEEVALVRAGHGLETGVLDLVLRVGPEVRVVAREVVVEELAAAAGDVATLDLALHSLHDAARANADWAAAQLELRTRLAPRLQEAALTDPWIAVDLVLEGMLPVAQLVERFGLAPVFAPRRFRHYIRATNASLISELFIELATEPADRWTLRPVVTDLVAILRATAPPWAERESVDQIGCEMVDHLYDDADADRALSDAWDADARLVAFAVMATLAESMERDFMEASPLLSQDLHTVVERVEQIAWSRPDQSGDLAVDVFGPDDRALVRAWLDGSVRLTY
ncbi:MAG: NACHT domain-containing protein [Actinobacteria bacterium]|nr:NACHT domain-containing protein [Actinomycetota bacterium]